MPNIKFEYLFRDESNYKKYGEVVLSNEGHLSLETIKRNISKNLIEGIWFHPDKWGVPKFSFHRIPIFGLNEYLWYEFTDVSETKKEITLTEGIEEFTFNTK
tara:strand:+ start:10476 stop:10781 length:306 start_codon:yes stop_codon:yes gene_type:complete